MVFKKKVDLVVLGGGTGGLRVALSAVNSGLKVALIESGVIGGTCLNNGCIPTKAMLQAAHTLQTVKNAKKFGILSSAKVNFSKVMNRVHEIIQEGQDHIKPSLKKKGLLYIHAKGSFIDSHTIVAGKYKVSFKNAFICTGAKNMVPPLPGKKITFLDNVSVLNLKKLPKSVTIIGGGYISMEYATFFSEMGSKVTIVEYAPQILSMLDEDVISELKKHYTSVRINTGSKITNIVQTKKQTTVTFVPVAGGKAKSVTSDALMVACGRVPNTKHLSLEKAKVTVGKRGEVVVSDSLQSNQKHIYAIGDVTGRALFAHAAKRETSIALHNITHSKKQKMNFDLVPWAVFTHPVVSGIGMSQKQAIASKIPFVTYRAPFSRAGRARVNGDMSGFVKIFVAKKDKRILGATIIGPNADDMIHEIATIMNSTSPTITTLQKTIHVHPTLSEVMESLREE